MALTGTLSLLIALALGPLITWQLSLRLSALLAVIVCYYLGVLWALSKGKYHPAIAWINVLLETSIPLMVLATDNSVRGPVYALNAPPLAVWSALIMFSVLRASRSLSAAAGILAGIEYLTFYFLVLYPHLPPDAPLSVQPAFIATRAFFLVSSGAAGAVLAHHLLRKAEQALQAVRAADLLSKYFLHEQLGAGGMAEVFRATYSPEGGFEKVVAIKRVLAKYSSDPHFTEMFKREAHICSRLIHPNIVQVTDVGRFDGNYVLAMEYIDGPSLRELLKARAGAPLPLSACTYVAAELASSLAYLHQRTDEQGQPLKLVHRDVNPPNVLLSRIGEVKLGDFGVAHAANRTDKPGAIVGKPTYLSPEQIKSVPIDGRADLFTLGLTLFEMLTGERALKGNSNFELMESVFKPFPPPSSLRPDVPPELDKLVLELLAVDPLKRPVSGTEVRARLMALTGTTAPYPNGEAALVHLVEEMRSAHHEDVLTAVNRDMAVDSQHDPVTQASHPSEIEIDIDTKTTPPPLLKSK
jgi:serine/threonine-protein kinase